MLTRVGLKLISIWPVRSTIHWLVNHPIISLFEYPPPPPHRISEIELNIF